VSSGVSVVCQTSGVSVVLPVLGLTHILSLWHAGKLRLCDVQGCGADAEPNGAVRRLLWVSVWCGRAGEWFCAGADVVGGDGAPGSDSAGSVDGGAGRNSSNCCWPVS
jgi:hypothetical protein